MWSEKRRWEVEEVMVVMGVEEVWRGVVRRPSQEVLEERRTPVERPRRRREGVEWTTVMGAG